jgi:hypothetical protein
MQLLDLLRVQHDRLEAAANVFRNMLAEYQPGSVAFEALNTSLKESVQEQRERLAFIRQVENALEACKVYRRNASAVSFAQLREAYSSLFVEQKHPLAKRHLPKLQPLGARAGCRSCAKALLTAIEFHLTAEVKDDFPLK